MIRLGVNIDHVATIREARKAHEPDVLQAALEAEAGGADSITAHLREDQRHIKYEDALKLRKSIRTKLNLEMSIARDIVDKALVILPEQATLVPERRKEITTKSGLDVHKYKDGIRSVIAELKVKKIIVSLFIDPVEADIRLSKDLGADFVEIHTGAYANAVDKGSLAIELERIRKAARICGEIGLGFNAGHGLNYLNLTDLLEIPNLYEVNIGHSIISRAVFTGIRTAVRDMKHILTRKP
jgi:pyridoxine 5-phosphate synthase